MYSAIIKAFHPPPHAVIVPVIREGSDAGKSNLLNFKNLVGLNESTTSLISLGIAFNPPNILNNRYHCMPVRIRMIAVMFKPLGI